jgi:hypothetical protein
MKRGDKVFLRRPQRLLSAELIADYANYPACRVKFRGRELIVARKDVVESSDADQVRLELRRQRYREQYADAISRWKPGMSRNEWESKNFHLDLDCGWREIKTMKKIGVIA